jgi:nitrite reductase/ring-hydroxylating ferredoxin subunit
MMPVRWVRVARAAEIPPGTGKPFRVAGRDVAVFHEGGDFLATDDTCPHQGASLADGTVHRGIVICPWHGWAFDPRDGSCVHVPGVAVATYRVRRRGEDVEVEIPDENGNGESDAGQASA